MPRLEDWQLAPCGTEAAARRHRRRGEPVCQACLRAERVRRQERRGGDPWDTHRGEPSPDCREIRNGIPWKPYRYRGQGREAS